MLAYALYRVKPRIGAQLQICFSLHEIPLVERTGSENEIGETRERERARAVEDSPRAFTLLDVTPRISQSLWELCSWTPRTEFQSKRVLEFNYTNCAQSTLDYASPTCNSPVVVVR